MLGYDLESGCNCQHLSAQIYIKYHGLTVLLRCHQVGPPSGKLKGRQPDEWKAKEVAETILADRWSSTLCKKSENGLKADPFVKMQSEALKTHHALLSQTPCMPAGQKAFDMACLLRPAGLSHLEFCLSTHKCSAERMICSSPWH